VRVIVGGIGYRNLRDHSIGVVVTDRLEAQSWPAGVVVEDISYNPIAVGQRLDDEPPEQRFERAVVVAAVERDGRAPGTVLAYRWDGVLPGDDEIHRAVTEAVTGVIALDNTLVVTRHFGGLPEDVVVIEVEPAVQEFGDELSAPVAAALERMCALAAEMADDAAAAARLPRAPLGGGRPAATAGGAS